MVRLKCQKRQSSRRRTWHDVEPLVNVGEKVTIPATHRLREKNASKALQNGEAKWKEGLKGEGRETPPVWVSEKHKRVE
jgi:hypothetical protein